MYEVNEASLSQTSRIIETVVVILVLEVWENKIEEIAVNCLKITGDSHQM